MLKLGVELDEVPVAFVKDNFRAYSEGSVNFLFWNGRKLVILWIVTTWFYGGYSVSKLF